MKKTFPMKGKVFFTGDTRTYIHTDGHCDSMTESAQWADSVKTEIWDSLLPMNLYSVVSVDKCWYTPPFYSTSVASDRSGDVSDTLKLMLKYSWTSVQSSQCQVAPSVTVIGDHRGLIGDHSGLIGDHSELIGDHSGCGPDLHRWPWWLGYWRSSATPPSATRVVLI